MENILFSVLVALLLAVGLSVVIFLPAYLQAAKNKSELSQSTAVKAPGKFTVEEVAKHQCGNDCWLIIKDKVYDVTEFVNEHPGGDSILNNAGGENTKAFYGPQHPAWAYDRVREYYIGDIVQQAQQ